MTPRGWPAVAASPVPKIPHRTSPALPPSLLGREGRADGLRTRGLHRRKVRPPGTEGAAKGQGLIGREGRPIWKGRRHSPPSGHLYEVQPHLLCQVPDKPEVTSQGSLGGAFHQATPGRPSAGGHSFVEHDSAARRVRSPQGSRGCLSQGRIGHPTPDLGGRRRERGDRSRRQAFAAGAEAQEHRAAGICRVDFTTRGAPALRESTRARARSCPAAIDCRFWTTSPGRNRGKAHTNISSHGRTPVNASE